jgi:hypothetical protein
MACIDRAGRRALVGNGPCASAVNEQRLAAARYEPARHATGRCAGIAEQHPQPCGLTDARGAVRLAASRHGTGFR